MEKLLLMKIAAELTAAGMQGVGQGLPVSPDLKDTQVRAHNVQVWETFRTYYHGILGALQDNQSWPAPKISLEAMIQDAIKHAIPELTKVLTPLMAGKGQLGTMVQHAQTVLGSMAQMRAPVPPAAMSQLPPGPFSLPVVPTAPVVPMPAMPLPGMPKK
jgi:hypothetical protein